MRAMDASPFSSRLATNYAATEEEAIQLSQLLSEPTAKLTKLDEEINRLFSVHAGLCGQHDALRRQVEEHRALMAPIKRLSKTLLQRIFLHCLPTEHNSLMSRYESPILLTQVCSGWRQIAHSTPSLWASIHIAIPNELKRRTYAPELNSTLCSQPETIPATCSEMAERRSAEVREWLRRSGECLLSISLYKKGKTGTRRPRYSNGSGRHCESIIDALIGVSHRWDRVSFEIPTAHLHRIAALSQSDVPKLRSLTVTNSSCSFNPLISRWQREPLNDFLGTNNGILKAPLLREISYNQDLAVFIKFPLKWAQLTRISLTMDVQSFGQNVSFSVITHLLGSCPLLVRCDLDVMNFYPPDTEPVSVPQISLPDLKTLSIQAQKQCLCSLFNALEVPSLQKLKFVLPVSQPALLTESDDVIIFLDRTGATLQKLAFNPMAFTKPAFFRCIQSCPRVTTLSLKTNGVHPAGSTYAVEDDLLHAFVEPQHHDGSFLLPDLTAFECFTAGNFSDEAIVDFVRAKRSRTPGLAILKLIAISLDRLQTMAMTKELRPYVEDGLECYLSYTPQYLVPDRLDSVYDGTVDYFPPSWRQGANLLQF